MNVRRLLADQWGNDTGDAAEFNFDAVIRRFLANLSNEEWILSLRRDKDMNEPRFGGGRDHGEANWRSRGIEVQQQGKGEAVANVGGQVKVILRSFSVRVASGNLRGGGVDRHVEGFWKRRSALDVAITDEPEELALRKHGRLIV